jgi:arginyl-tRNA synthetase
MLQQELQQLMHKAVKDTFPEWSGEVVVEPTAKQAHGDFASPVSLSLAKQFHQSPMDIANALASKIQKPGKGAIDTVTVASPGFINIRVANTAILEELSSYQVAPQQHPQQPAKAQRIMVEFSSPNIAKPFNVGHLRSTIIGDAVARVYAYLGATVLKDNHLGDWGTQYGKLAYAVEKWGDWAKIEENPNTELFALYVRINEEATKDESLQEEARLYFKRLEEGDPHVRQIWQKLSELSRVDFDRLYQKFNVTFDMMLGESFYEPYLNDVIQECVDAGLAQESQGALVIFPPGANPQDPPVIIRKSNGTSTYDTRDLAGIRYRFQQFCLDKLIIEIGNEQQFYFKRIIAIAEAMGWVKPGQIVHVGHGLFLGGSGKKLSTRKGETVWLQELVAELEARAEEIVSKKSPDLSAAERTAVAEQIAVGALKYNDLSQNRLSNITFDKEKALSLEGNSAPYLQYTIARANSVLRQAQVAAESPSADDLSDIERQLALAILQFNLVVEQVVEDYFPSQLTSYLYQTAQKFNSFYQTQPILKAPPAVRERRLQVTAATATVLAKGLELLGVSTPNRM